MDKKNNNIKKDVKVEAEVKIIKVSFRNKKADAIVTQYIVKIPKRIVDEFNITNENKIYFQVREDENKKSFLYMELR